MILKGNCLDTLKTLPDSSVDSIVTDPPYELGFMGKSWDASGIAYNAELWAECLRVLKPGGHLLAFSGSRTYHRMTVAIEDAGFEIRDQIMWLYGSGFPKSLDVSKAMDKAAGYVGETIGTEVIDAGIQGGSMHAGRERNLVEREIKQLSPEAQRWQGWGTALKPAHEPICVARKPLVGTVANNVLTYGTGALNIDGTRVGYADGEVNFDRVQRQQHSEGAVEGAFGASALIGKEIATYKADGRWPANVIHDGSDEVLAGFPTSKSGTAVKRNGVTSNGVTGWGKAPVGTPDVGYPDEGSAARFFYCAKASKAERNAGLEGLPAKFAPTMNDGIGGKEHNPETATPKQNFHPTVKPLALMRYLIKLVTPPGGTVLDPFLGSGSTAVAAVLEGFQWIGCEMTEDYFPIIEARVAWAEAQPKRLIP
jgi:DNA modification methylase